MAITVAHATQATGTDAGNGEIRKTQWNENHTVTGVADIFAQSGTASSVGAVITETTLATISFSGGEMGANGWIRVYTFWTVNNNANTKTVRVRLGGAAGTAFYGGDLASQVFCARESLIVNANSVSAQKAHIAAGNNTGSGVGTSAPPTATVNTAAAWDLVITGQKSNSADTITLEGYQVLVFKAA